MHILWLICTPTSRQTLVSGRDMESCGFCHPPPPYPLLPCNRCPIWVPASQTAPKLGPLAISGVMMFPMWWKSLVERSSVSHGTFVASFKARQCRSVTEDPLCPPLTLSHSCVQHSSTILSRSNAVKLSEDSSLVNIVSFSHVLNLNPQINHESKALISADFHYFVHVPRCQTTGVAVIIQFSTNDFITRYESIHQSWIKTIDFSRLSKQVMTVKTEMYFRFFCSSNWSTIRFRSLLIKVQIKEQWLSQ